MAFPLSHTRAEQWDLNIEDKVDVLAMLVPITVEEASERRDTFGVPGPIDATREWFRCVHWDEETRLCGNYENRPHLCRGYPYGHPCEYGCDCDCDLAPRVWEGDYA